jgi:hypothetical protein
VSQQHEDERALALMERILAEGRAAGHGTGSIRKRIVDAVQFGRPSLRMDFMRKHLPMGRGGRKPRQTRQRHDDGSDVTPTVRAQDDSGCQDGTPKQPIAGKKGVALG